MAGEAKKTRKRRDTIGFVILKDLGGGKYERLEEETTFDSYMATEKFIKKNAEKFADMTLMVAHFKRPITISVETKKVVSID